MGGVAGVAVVEVGEVFVSRAVVRTEALTCNINPSVKESTRQGVRQRWSGREGYLLCCRLRLGIGHIPPLSVDVPLALALVTMHFLDGDETILTKALETGGN